MMKNMIPTKHQIKELIQSACIDLEATNTHIQVVDSLNFDELNEDAKSLNTLLHIFLNLHIGANSPYSEQINFVSAAISSAILENDPEIEFEKSETIEQKLGMLEEGTVFCWCDDVLVSLKPNDSFCTARHVNGELASNRFYWGFEKTPAYTIGKM
ncbi:hypothetical protein [Vibrio parahaemolyticus]|uniref:hypothetical protein n=1 Tax=Vibrio parahaemolyticus TaxID=670 RepID=UPI002111D48A|nr:hypothetical protein [Vibrio parahaemolyticus]